MKIAKFDTLSSDQDNDNSEFSSYSDYEGGENLNVESHKDSESEELKIQNNDQNYAGVGRQVSDSELNVEINFQSEKRPVNLTNSIKITDNIIKAKPMLKKKTTKIEKSKSKLLKSKYKKKHCWSKSNPVSNYKSETIKIPEQPKKICGSFKESPEVEDQNLINKLSLLARINDTAFNK